MLVATQAPSSPPLTPPAAAVVTHSIMIDYIEVVNFKSYAGLVRIGPFHERLTAIIGPNGSGKSNIIDSLLFVFGRRAGQLRQKNLTGLIHTSRDCNPESARVAIKFVNERRTYLFTLAREIHQSGSSKYLIENSQVTYQEMITFVKGHGIDLDHNRFLILQGEVENLSTLPPKGNGGTSSGLLEILEDLFGSNDLIPIILEKEEKCKDLKEALDDSDTRLSRCNLELTSLVGPCREAYGYINSHKNLLAVKADLHGKEIWKLRKQKNQFDAEVTALSEARAAINDHELYKRLDESRNVFKEASGAFEAVAAEVSKGKANITKLQLEEDRLSAAIASQQRALEEWERSVAALEQECTDKQAEAKEIITQGEFWRDSGLGKLKAELDKVRDEIVELDAALSAERECSNQKLRTLIEERDSVVEVKLGEVNKQLDEKIKLRELSQRDLASRDVSNLKTKLKDCRAKIQEKIAKIDELCLNRDEIRKIAEKRQESVKKMRERAAELEIKKQRLHEQIDAAGGGAAAAGGRTSQLLVRLKREFNDSSSSLHLCGHWLLDYVECEDVDKIGYALTAGGLGEDVIITEADEASEQIIQFVKRYGLGRVTCVTIGTALQRWRQHMDDWRKKTQAGNQKYDRQVASPLMSYVKVKPYVSRDGTELDISPLIWARLRDTLICTGGDIGVARKIAFGGRERFRVVTMKGEVIEKNGSMTGGSSVNYLKQRTQLFLPRVTTDQGRSALQSLEKDHKSVEEELEKIKFSLRNSSFDENRINQQLTDIQRDVNVAVGEGKELEKMYTDLKNVYSTKQAEMNSDENKAKYQQLENAVHNLAAEIQEIEKVKAKVQTIMTGLQNQIAVEGEKLKNIGGVKRANLQSEKSRLDKEIAQRTDLVNNMLSLSSAAEQRAIQIREALLPEANTRVCAARDELKLKRTLFEQTVDTLGQANKAQNERTTRQKEIEERLVQAKTVKQEIENSVKALQAEDRQLESKMSDIKMELTAVERNIANKLNVVKQLRKDFDDFIDFDESNVQSQTPPALGNESSHPAVADGNEEDPVPPESPSTHGVQLESVKFPDVDDSARYEEKPTSDFQLEVHKWTENVDCLGNTTMDISVLTRFQTKNEEVIELKAERNRRKEELEDLYGQLQDKKQERRQLFDAGFSFLSDKVKELYQMLTRGGDAELEYKACHCPFAEGVEFSVRPPGKSWRSINKLSGGEKTLSSLALIFALHHYKPTPIYVLDEIDAALDTQNVILIASYVAACQANNAQFIVISLRHELFQRADRLIGVCKVADKTKICVIDPDAFSEQENKRARDDGAEPIVAAIVSQEQ